MGKFLGRIVATVMCHFFPIVVIAGLISVVLSLFSIPMDTGGPIGLVVAIGIMMKWV